jgi:1,4-dihydroxy-2-naphthoate polyprenyltransferase
MNKEKKSKNYLFIWWKALRFHFTYCSSLPALLGFAIALEIEGLFNLFYFLLTIIALICNHLALNIADDYYDYLHGTDIYKAGEKNFYAGGSGVLVEKELSPSSMYKAFVLLYCITIFIGVYLTLKLGVVILLFGIIGVFSSYYYTAPPVKFSYCGFGELAILLNFGPIIIGGTYYVATNHLPLSLLLLSLPSGLFTFSLILANELPDCITDKKAGKKTLVIHFGKKSVMHLSSISLLLAYFLIALAAALSLAPSITLLALLTIPLTYKSVRALYNSLNSKRIIGNADLIKALHLTIILLILSYCIQAIINKTKFHAYCILFTLLILFLPVIIKALYNKKEMTLKVSTYKRNKL